MADYPSVDAIKFNGVFPFAHLEYEDQTLPVECTLEAFSPLLPGDEKNSGWPAAIFKFKITNPFSRSMEVALLSSARNLIGEGGVGRFNQVVDTPKALHINFYNKKTQSHDPASGEMCLTILKNKNLECSYLGEWNMQGRHFVFDHFKPLSWRGVGFFCQRRHFAECQYGEGCGLRKLSSRRGLSR